MARLPRLTIPGHPHQIVQRGNNSQPICLGPADFTTLLDAIDGQAQKFKVAVHSYVIVESHFQLLATPETEMGLSQMMQAIGRSYVRYFNQSHGRSGTLWEGRYKSTVIQADRYLLPCMVYMDLLPVRQGTVPSPSDYPWSSHGHYSGRLVDRIIKPHALTWALGNTPFAREAAYTELVRSGVSRLEESVLAQADPGGWVLGGEDFVADLQKNTTRRLTKRLSGRPAIASKSLKK
jgi:putative transposase